MKGQLPSTHSPDPGYTPRLRQYDPRMPAYTLTEEDERIIREVREVYHACRHTGSFTSHRDVETDDSGRVTSKTADELLDEYGVLWAPGNARWYAIERAVRGWSNAILEDEREEPTRGRKKEEVEPRPRKYCGEDMPYRESEGPYSYSRRRFCDQDCWHAYRSEKRQAQREAA